MHYSCQWKLSQREKIRRRTLCFGTYPNLILAPSHFWKDTFEARLKSLLEDNDKFLGDNCACEETIIDVPEFAFHVLQLFVNAPLRESQSEDCVNSMKI